MPKDTVEKSLSFGDIKDIKDLFGNFDKNLRIIEEEIDVAIVLREDELKISGEEEEVGVALKTFETLIQMQKDGQEINENSVDYVVHLARDGEVHKREELNEVIITTARGKAIKPKTFGQKRYIDEISRNEIVFGIGPAGTGKTYLAMAMAVKAFKNKQVNKIILTRPAVEAGEKLGFLPGDMQEKVDPYLRPLYDALFDIMGEETYQKNLERGLIEVAPLAYMRGRTLNDSYIILDEAQNTTPEQMKMFLTRLGFGSKAIITGDITQIDLPRGKTSGLKEVVNVLSDVRGIAFVNFSEKDVVRHKLVQKIVKAYEKYETNKAEQEECNSEQK